MRSPPRHRNPTSPVRLPPVLQSRQSYSRREFLCGSSAPLSVLPATQIDCAVKVTPCTECVDLQPCPLRLREVYVGAATDEKKYQAFERFTQSHLPRPIHSYGCPEYVSNILFYRHHHKRQRIDISLVSRTQVSSKIRAYSYLLLRRSP